MNKFISNQEIRISLIPWLGSTIITKSFISEKLSTILNNFNTEKQGFNYLYDKIYSNLKATITNYSNNNIILLDNNTSVKCTETDIQDMADDIIGLFFSALEVNSINFTKINQYAMNKNSLTALKCLYLNFNNFYNVDEKGKIKRLIESLYPKHCYSDWL